MRAGICRLEPDPVRLESARNVFHFHSEPARLDHQVLQFVVKQVRALGGCGARRLGDDGAGTRTKLRASLH